MNIDLSEFKINKTPIAEFIDKNNNHLFVKEESKNPSGSIKDRVFLYGLKKLLSDGKIESGYTLEIASSGNAAISLATIAPFFGLKVKVYMPSSTSSERRTIMNVMQIEAHYIEGGMTKTIEEAKKEAEKPNNFYFDQFFDPIFLGAHEDTAKEISEELSNIDYIVSGVGTGITINALSSKLKKYYPNLKIIAYEPDEAHFLSEHQFGPHSLEGVGPNFYPPNVQGVNIEKIVSITKNEAYDMAIELFKHGHDYGITTAANIVAATKSGLANKNILVINYDSIQKYLNVLNNYVTEKN